MAVSASNGPAMRPGDDEWLVGAFAAREPEAFARAYERHGAALQSVARHVLGSSGAAEDCVHDALLRVWGTPNSYRAERGSLRAFLIACVRNEAMSRLRREGRRAEREHRAQRLEPVVEAAAEPVDHVEAARVRAALRRLPDEQRVPLEEAYFACRTQSEIAEQLGVPLGTLKSRIALGMRKLHADLRATSAIRPV